MLGMGALAYALAVPWMPPSTILNTQAAVQGFDPAYKFNPHHLVYMVALAAGTWVLIRLFGVLRAPMHLRFFLLFFFYMAAVTLGWYWFGVTLLGQPHRFHMAMEMGFTLSLVFAARLVLAAMGGAAAAGGGGVRGALRFSIHRISKLCAPFDSRRRYHANERVQDGSVVRPAYAR
jgi:hypothetical protein